MKNLVRDLRYALRMLVKHPAFTATAVVSLALGIGANSAIFSIVKAVFFHPLPLAEADRLVAIYTTDAKNPGFFETSYPTFSDFSKQAKLFSGLSAHHLIGLNLASGGKAEVVFGEIVSGNYFEVLGVKPVRGRFFLPEEDSTPGSPPVAVVGYSLWRYRFGGDPKLIGSTIYLNHQAFTVVGVAPPAFTGTDVGLVAKIWVPVMTYQHTLPDAAGLFRERRALLFNVLGRLAPGASLAQAAAALKGTAAQIERAYPDSSTGRGVTLIPLLQAAVNPNARQGVLLATGVLGLITGTVLLIACANVAGLLLARAAARRREIAIRFSLGAGRARVIRQLLTESLLIALLGGAVGLLLAAWIPQAIWGLLPQFPIPVALDFSLDPRVFGFTLLLSLAGGLLFGLAPALQAGRDEQVTALKEGAPAGGSARKLTLRKVLVVGQVGFSTLALMIAVLFAKSVQNAQRIDPGFNANRLLIATFSLGAQGYDEPRALQFYGRLLDRVRTLPGVRAASLAAYPPLGGGFNRSVYLEGSDAQAKSNGNLIPTNVVEPAYFETAGIPLLRGRAFNSGDRAGAQLVAIVNQTMADRLWAGRDPIGQRFRFFGSAAPLAIVGVARATKYVTLGEAARPFIYLPLAQHFLDSMVLHARTEGNPAPVLEEVRRQVQALDGSLPLLEVATVADLMDRSLWVPRMGAALVGGFGLLALLLAAVGIYGLMAYTVSQRTSEIGIQMALGARPLDVLGLVLRQGMTLVAIGIAGGLAAGVAISKLLGSLLFDVSTSDPAVLATSVVVLAATALLAIYLPAHRAARIDPAEALRG
jgi:macrolide transport system ATP-binding/permease protein